ncbi:hypothetical protein [Methylocapsa acidiphila]|uniref:hypothetical protein n=1 Tax=Methylocapsa acidiphila TaxID=133552 RepID=UPI0003F50981|nr:hypothetical protein [Methylocapsa acidiphila]
MFFLLRVVFWLGIVFASLPWPEDFRPARAGVETKAREMLGAAVDGARAGIGKVCLDAPAACLDAAGGLGRLASAAAREGKAPKPQASAARP